MNLKICSLLAAGLLLWPLLAHARPARGPLTVEALKGATEAEARARLGAPDVARAEGKGALWTYRLSDCALLVFFRSEGDGPRRLSGASSSPRRRGDAPAPVDACLNEAAERGAHAPAPAKRPPPEPDDAPF
jgi:hypothetical protein